jgi:RNA polymerase sigma-70 factor, ECF subfamily
MHRSRIESPSDARTLERVRLASSHAEGAASSPAEERALVERARRGDQAAFGQLVGRYGPMVLSLAYASTLNRSDAEDIAQETFVSAWRSLPGFRGDASFSTWVYGLARSRCTDWARRASVRPRLWAGNDRFQTAGISSEPGSEDRKTAGAIMRAAAALPLPQRQAVLMRDLQGLSYEEIAAVQDVAVGTVRSRISAARRLIAAEAGA